MKTTVEETQAAGSNVNKSGSGKRWAAMGGGLYRENFTGILYERPTIHGKRTWRSLETTRDKIARDEMARRRVQELQARTGAIQSPYVLKKFVYVGEVIDKYKTDGCLDRQRQRRPDTTKEAEEKRCDILKQFWKSVSISDVTIAQFDRYCDWRRNRIVETKSRGKGGYRSVDCELNTLNNAFVWAVRCELVQFNPLNEKRPKYDSEKNVEHCRKFMARNADELHAVARFMFKRPIPAIVPGKHGGYRSGITHRSEVAGWQYLFEAFTGLRTQEALKMRTDAQPDEPGYIETDEQGNWKVLHIGRCKDGVNPFVIITPEMEQLLRALFTWRNRRFPKSQWYFPSYKSDGAQPIDRSTLSHNLIDASKQLKKKFTSHGARAFYVTVRRSWGIPDMQIKTEIGHTPGSGTLEEIYGGVPTNWLTGNGPKMTFIPKTAPPSWDVLETAKQDTNIVQLAPMAQAA
jgi:hypothetical protein